MRVVDAFFNKVAYLAEVVLMYTAPFVFLAVLVLLIMLPVVVFVTFR